jgi:drug/metabolite transporter (DMT)-like permease
MTRLHRQDRQALLLGLIAVVLWSTAATAFKIALRHLDVLQLLFGASVVSMTVLLIIVAYRGQAEQLRRCFVETPTYYLRAALLNPCLYYLILLSAYQRLPAQQAQAINYTWAITLGLMAVFMLGQRMRRIDWLTTVVGYCGVLIIATRGDILSLQTDDGGGVALALLSTVVWAYYWIVNTRNLHDPVVSLCLNFLLAVPITFAACLMFSEIPIWSWEAVGAVIYVGSFEMGITFAIWSIALRRTTNISRVGNLIFISPLLSLLPIQFVLGEAIEPATLVGLALIIPAAMLQQMRPASE